MSIGNERELKIFWTNKIQSASPAMTLEVSSEGKMHHDKKKLDQINPIFEKIPKNTRLPC